jgi:hypothetical protein
MMDELQSPNEPTPNATAYPEADILNAIEQVIRHTPKAYSYQHLATIGTYLRQNFPAFNPTDYGCKKLLDLIVRYPERFRIKWSTPAHKGRSHVWVRLTAEPKWKEGYGPVQTKPKPSAPLSRLMTQKEFARLCEWLDGPQGCNFRPDPTRPEQTVWNCDGNLHKTRLWLKRRNLDAEKNIKLLRKLGGHCDCEVLFNVADNWPSPPDDRDMALQSD